LILHSPLGLLALLAVPVIVILYLLKQKHEDYVFSSLYLWQNAVQDFEANAPWQKLKKNLLMFLQILAVTLLAFALAEPYVKSGGNGNGEVLLVMDCSLSMQSTDVKPSRFEAAKKDALRMIEAHGDGAKFSLIASGSMPYIVLHRVGDKNKVMDEINGLRATDSAEDLEGTIELISSLKQQSPGIQVNWFSDGINAVSDENTLYYSYNRNGDNYAVTLLSQRKLQGSREITALSRIANFSTMNAELDVSLYTDGSLFDARRVKVKAGKSESLYWTRIPESVSSLECRIDTQDVLEKDNYAGVVVNSSDIRKVLLATEKNIFLEKVLTLIPGLELYRTSVDDVDELKGYDLYVFDGEMPKQLPDDGHIIVFKPPQNEYFSLVGESEYTEIRAAKHEIYNELTQDISFGALKSDLYRLPEWGYALMENDEGTAAFEGYIGKNRMMVFGFDLHETNLPVQPYFPVIMTRVVQELLPGGLENISAVYAGDPIELSVDPEAREVSVIAPDGEKMSIAPPFPVAAFDATMQIGSYTLEQQLENETVRQTFFVNAPSEREYAQSEYVSLDEQNTKEPQDSKTPGLCDVKMLLLWFLLATFIIEWWVYTNGISI
jgi:Ca-activated chloride channel family protein